MFDQSYGLRFDIYERIQLSDNVAGIAELEEIELLPHIQVISQEDQATLRGHLLLNGLYRGEGEEDVTQRLEHFIPVEITVPLSRVTSIDEIAVEIENFDIDLLSTRSLNITGVLSLRGIEAPPNDRAAWDAEEFTVVHAPDWSVEQDATAQSASQNNTLLEQSEELKYADEVKESAVSVPEHWANEDVPDTSVLHTENQFIDADRSKQVSNVWHFEPEDETELIYPEIDMNLVDAEVSGENLYGGISVHSLENDNSEESDHSFASTPGIASTESNDEKSEVRIAVGSKQQLTAEAKENFGLSSILSSSRSMRDLEQQAQEVQQLAEEIELDKAAVEDVQWKSLFLGSSAEKSPFSKVRLCIVQKEETIDMIADRYQMSSRELLLYNRLSEQTIEEGQVLYIP
ncbi:LysM peptidoglycan-binding domain-containing protein [Paenibacillus sp. IHBB 10380]|uniref:LysM peptidoglycan-binding domain-containing protein n=1 Tax=Paenibacillus sp. IHBB 10380 TaxID=1566358 RepID=UPI000696E346|nr:LysM peptidoglycan-binding domain-containing protein [Paenibacillus sp. IHBB 10380]